VGRLALVGRGSVVGGLYVFDGTAERYCVYVGASEHFAVYLTL